MNSLTLLFVAFALLSCCQAAHFSTSSPDDGAILNVCVGDTLVLPWNLLLTIGDVIEDIKWYFTDHTNNREMIALSAIGVFFPMPAYSTQLHNVNKTALIVNNVRRENAGNFSVYTIIRDNSGTLVTLERSVHVDVGAGLQTSDGRLHVTFEQKAVQNSTGHWTVKLYCGNFTYLSSPPFNVQWQLPSGAVVEETGTYTAGHFTLELSSPVRGGNYSCKIPRESSASACLNGVETNGEATLHVDGTEVRLLLLEASQEKSARHVSFHATGLQDDTPNYGGILIFPTITTNQGGAYSNNTGVFTAPFAGTYFFAAQTGSDTTDKYAAFVLTVDGRQVSWGRTTDPGPGETTSIQAVLSLRRGSRVRVRAFPQSSGVAYMNRYYATFTGFLLHSD